MITTLLVDDEAHNRNVLRLLLEKHCPGLTIVGEASTAREAFEKINRYTPKLVFLDIKMPRKSGFELLKMFPKIDFEVVFVTAFNKYAIKAFEFNALGYILKPIDEAKLSCVIKRVSERIQKNADDNIVLHFVKSLSETETLINKLSVHHNGHVVLINIHEIASIEAGEDNTRITLCNNARYYSSKRLAQFESLLEGTGDFIRINKGVIINTEYIHDYTKGELCVINMDNRQSFEVSRRRKVEILKILNDNLI
jgi:two-component system, LytTR family, response regulator